MRKIHISQITEAIAKLCVDANYILNDDILCAFRRGIENETDELPKSVLEMLIENAGIAEADNLPICQDTGMAVIFAEIGQDVHIAGGSLTEAIDEGVRIGYEKGYLRKSVVEDPIRRENTNDNTPAVIHYDIVAGGKIKLWFAPKGFGSENMSAVKMLTPSDGLSGIKDFVLQAVKNAGGNPCPPVIVGVGIGGTMEKAAMLSKKALFRSVGEQNMDGFWADIENELLKEINKLNIGPAGFGGKTTAIGVNIEVFPTHIAGLPVAVNIGCNATRHKEIEI